MRLLSFKHVRILILLTILAYVAIYSRSQELETTSWVDPLQVVIFPVNGDSSKQTAQYIQSLKALDFQDIEKFFANNIKQYGINYLERSVIVQLGDVVDSLPPKPPTYDASIVSKMFWSLSLRNWASNNTPDSESNLSRVRLFVIYHQGAKNQALAHSLGLQKGLIGVVHAFAIDEQEKQNNVVIAHEIMHTVGATDKYNADGTAVYPDGYAEPLRKPLHPQVSAEIMAGRVAIDAKTSEMPESLKQVVVGSTTAKEIGWIASE